MKGFPGVDLLPFVPWLLSFSGMLAHPVAMAELYSTATPAERAWCAEASEWFGRFVRPEAGAWKELAPLLGLLIERDGSFDNGLDDLDGDWQLAAAAVDLAKQQRGSGPASSR